MRTRALQVVCRIYSHPQLSANIITAYLNNAEVLATPDIFQGVVFLLLLISCTTLAILFIRELRQFEMARPKHEMLPTLSREFPQL